MAEKKEGIGLLIGLPKGDSGPPMGGEDDGEEYSSDEAYQQEFMAHLTDTGLGLDEDQAMALKHAIEACVASKLGG